MLELEVFVRVQLFGEGPLCPRTTSATLICYKAFYFWLTCIIIWKKLPCRNLPHFSDHFWKDVFILWWRNWLDCAVIHSWSANSDFWYTVSSLEFCGCNLFSFSCLCLIRMYYSPCHWTSENSSLLMAWGKMVIVCGGKIVWKKWYQSSIKTSKRKMGGLVNLPRSWIGGDYFEINHL